MYRKFVKRPLDVALSLIGTIVLSPLTLVLAVLIKLDSPGPVIFKQKRIGINKTFFDIKKYRTMRTDTPKDMPTHLLENPEQHITRIGRMLRKTSLDELPQIWQILTGKMSIIGPRPALWNQDDLIAERDKYSANEIKPGLTGWAQINGRDELPIEIKAKYDGEYAQNINFKMDCKCFFGTIRSVLKKENITGVG